MKNLRAKTIAGMAVALIAVTATGCGSHLANNAHGLRRANEGVGRNNTVIEQRDGVRPTHRAGRVGLRRGNRRVAVNPGTPTTHSRRGIDRTTTENRYLNQEHFNARDNGRFMGNETVGSRERVVGETRLDGARHRNDGVLRQDGMTNRSQYNNNVRNTVFDNTTPYYNGDNVVIGNDGAIHMTDGIRTPEPINTARRTVR